MRLFIPSAPRLTPFYLLIFLFSGITIQSFAQDHNHKQKKHGHIRLGLVIGHTLIPTVIEGEKENLLIPSWGMDLEYWFNQRWGIGLHNDIEVETFEVLSEDDEYIERIYPMVFTLDILWRPWKGLVLLAGPGIEVEQNRNLQVFRLGAEYEVALFQGWDLSPNFFYDARSNAFGTWSVGLGVGKRF